MSVSEPKGYVTLSKKLDAATDGNVNNVSNGAESIPEPVQPLDTEKIADSEEHKTLNSTAETYPPNPDEEDLGPKPAVQVDYPSDCSDLSDVSDIDELDDQFVKMFPKRNKMLASSIYFNVLTSQRLKRLEEELVKLKAEATAPKLKPARDDTVEDQAKDQVEKDGEDKIDKEDDSVVGDKPGPSQPDDPLSKHAPPPGMTWEESIARVDLAEFRKRSGFKPEGSGIRPFVLHGEFKAAGASEPTRHVIEVLMEKQQITLTRRKLRQKMGINGKGSTSAEIQQSANKSGVNGTASANEHTTFEHLDSASAAMAMSAHTSPSCVRIRSKAVSAILSKITGVTYSANATDSLLIRKPFKVLVTFEAEIRSHLKELEKLHGDKGDDGGKESDLEASTKRKSDGGKEIESEATAKRKLDAITNLGALRDMRLLVEFMDTDLGPIFKARAALADGTQTTVTFDDLWYLFRHGQEVTTRVDGSKAYQILKFGGGRVPSKALYPNQRNSGSDDEAEYDFVRRKKGRKNAERNENFQRNPFFVSCLHYWMNGKTYIPVIANKTILPFDGERKVTDLPIFPLKFITDWASRREKLIARGTRFISLCSSKETVHKQYIGRTLRSEGSSEDIDSQIIVDFEMYSKVEKNVYRRAGNISDIGEYEQNETADISVDIDCTDPGCCSNDYILKDYHVDQQIDEDYLATNPHLLESTDNPEELDDGEKLLLPKKVYGFILRNRKWALFHVDLVKDLTYSNGFDDLVLPEGHKDSVRALVTNHLESSKKAASQEEDVRLKTTSIDLVRNKGKGLIILLHGQPGVGKTSTAECVADYTKRPLYPITCGDIGDNATMVESNLEKNFSLAHEWNCVLLLDEADVFLSKRDRTDLKRNAIVSVFLRTLEYYSGILFLTTNRVGTFDPAFKSRIHISLYYPDLDRKATLAIWKMHLGRVKKAQRENFCVNETDIIAFAKEHYKSLMSAGSGSWNGRQIRNAFQTALALAEFEAREHSAKFKRDQVDVELKREHFKKVAEASQVFDHYLKVMFGGKSESDLAAQERVRAQLPTKGSKAGGKGNAVSRKEVDFEDEKASEEEDEDSENDDDEE